MQEPPRGADVGAQEPNALAARHSLAATPSTSLAHAALLPRACQQDWAGLGVNGRQPPVAARAASGWFPAQASGLTAHQTCGPGEAGRHGLHLWH